jgi:hypothetical protein
VREIELRGQEAFVWSVALVDFVQRYAQAWVVM